jgi:hypothetical protein
MCVWVQRFLVSDEQNDHTQGFRTQDSRTQEVKKSPGRRSGSDSGGEKLRPVEAWKLELIRLPRAFSRLLRSIPFRQHQGQPTGQHTNTTYRCDRAEPFEIGQCHCVQRSTENHDSD